MRGSFVYLAGFVIAGPLLTLAGCVSQDDFAPVPKPLVPSNFSSKGQLPSLVPERLQLRADPTDSGPEEREAKAGGGPPRVELEEVDGAHVLDLATALQIGGANNLQVKLAREQLAGAHARLDQAEVLWLPDISAGVGYNKHEGRLQETEGEILQVSRNAGFVGAGLFASFNLADAFLEPRSAISEVDAAGADLTARVNDGLLNIAHAYNDLLQAQTSLALAREDTALAEELVLLTEAFSRSGQGLEADAARARNELAHRKKLVVSAEQIVSTRSVRLATLLRRDPAVPLRASEPRLIPFTLVTEDVALTRLIEQGMRSRPELQALSSAIQAEEQRERQESLRPFIPQIELGVRGGGLGGGTGSDFGNFGEEGELFVGLSWNLRNFGFGEAAARRQRESLTRAARIRHQIARDAVAEQVTTAYVHAQEGRRQVELALQNVKEALSSLDLNMQRIHAAEGLPIEALEALRAAADARESYVTSVGAFNRAQFDLLRAVGRPIKP